MTNIQRRASQHSEDRLVRFMGLFGIGLGIAELVAGRKIARRVGLGDDKVLLAQGYGVREIVSGVLCMTVPAGGIWTRVAGDALDVATLVRRSRPTTRIGALSRKLGSAAMVPTAGIEPAYPMDEGF